jgi:hypothetical protein
MQAQVCHTPAPRHYQAERLRPIDWEQKRLGLAQKFGLAALIDLADELDSRIAQQWCDLFAEIFSITSLRTCNDP